MLSFYSYATEELINLFVNYSIPSFYFFFMRLIFRAKGLSSVENVVKQVF